MPDYGFFRFWGTVQNPISSDIPRWTPRLVSKIDYGFDQWSVVSFVIKKLFVYLFMVKECIYLAIQMYLMQIYFYLLWFGNKFTDFFVFSKFLLALHTRWNVNNVKFWENTKFNLKAKNFSLTMRRNLLYFNFTKPR